MANKLENFIKAASAQVIKPRRRYFKVDDRYKTTAIGGTGYQGALSIPPRVDEDYIVNVKEYIDDAMRIDEEFMTYEKDDPINEENKDRKEQIDKALEEYKKLMVEKNFSEDLINALGRCTYWDDYPLVWEALPKDNEDSSLYADSRYEAPWM